MTSALYEYLAEAFYCATRVMAPGKDTAAAMGGSAADDELRRSLWANWLTTDAAKAARERYQDELRDASAEALNEASGLTDDEARESEESYQ